MKLKYWNYDLGESGEYDEIEYPNEIIKEFVDFLRLNKQWPERLEIMYNRFLVFQRDLTEVRNERALEAANQEIRCTATTKSGERCKRTTGIRDGICAVHRRTLAVV